MFVGSVTVLIALLGLSSTPANSKAIAVEKTLHPLFHPVIDSSIISPKGELIPVRDLLHKRRQERYVYEYSDATAEEGFGEYEPGRRFCCCPGQLCTETKGESMAKGKSFSLGFNAGGAGQNLAAKAADAARQISGSFGFDFSYGWSETFTATASSTCGVAAPGLTVAVGETQPEPCVRYRFRPFIVRSTWKQWRRNLCKKGSEWEEYQASAEEPVVIDGLRQGEWSCPSDGDHDMNACTNVKTYAGGEARTPAVARGAPTPTL